MTFSFKAAGGSTSAAGEKKNSQGIPWVEKYRPKKLEDVSAQDHTVTVLKRTLQSDNLPHMLFYGPPGTGKTSTVLALAKELFGPTLMKTRVLELNASDERGIAIVREKVKDFARTMVSAPSPEDRAKYPCPPYKLIVLDEADSMTSDAQSALRRTMETYSKITRFCLICNYVTRIIDPLASRCSKFRFKPLDVTNALERLTYIADSEHVNYDPEALKRLLDTAGGDLRKAITFLQSASQLQKQPMLIGDDDDQDDDNLMEVESKVTVEQVNEISGTVPDSAISELVELVQNNPNATDRSRKIRKAVDEFVYSGWSGAQVIQQLHDKLLVDELISNGQKNKIALILSQADHQLTEGSDEHLQLLSTALQIGQAVN